MEYAITQGTKEGYSQVSFTSRPGDAVLDALRAAGLRWSRHNKVWYGKITEDNLRAVIDNVGPAPEATPQDHIKIYWNGMKIDGKLTRCYYYKHDDDSISVSARDYEDLPRDLFTVKNNTDLYTDYFDNDRTNVGPDHPLYKYIAYAEAAASLRAGRIDAIPMKNPGQPTAEDLAEIKRQRDEEKAARDKAAREEMEREWNKVLQQRDAGKKFIEDTAAAYPIKDGEPVVTILWSEDPSFYSYEDGELKLSLNAAEIILKHFDELRASEEGYYKTKFRITCTDENGEESSYEGRYDLGDNDGGIIAHIRDLAIWDKEHNNSASADGRIEWADYLQSFIAA